MEDQGIMALPQGMQAPTAQAPAIDPAAEAAFEQARMQMDPKEFGDEILAAGEQADPAAVQEFKQALMAAQLPPEIIDAIGAIVDMVLEDPASYQELRAELLSDPQAAETLSELLPPEFDAAYFGALNMALDQMSGAMTAPMEPQGFAMGGLAQTPVAAGIAQLGRNGDTRLAHITPSEARMLRRRGGSGTINPATGLPEYGLKSFVKAVTKPFRSVAKAAVSSLKSVAGAVKKFASSSIGRIITAVALGVFLGPAAAAFLGVGSGTAMAAAISGFVGGAGSTLLAGGNLKDALKAGAIGGVTAGTMSYAGGAEFFAPSTTTASEAFANSVSSAKEGLSSLMGGTQPPAPITNAQGIESLSSGPPPVTPPTVAPSGTTAQFMAPPGTAPTTLAPDYAASGDYASLMQAQPPATSGMIVPGQTPLPEGMSLKTAAPTTGAATTAAPTAATTAAQKVAVPGIYDSIKSAGSNLAGGEYMKAASNLGDAFFGTTPRMIATGVGAAYLGGAFNPEPREELNIVPKETGSDLLAQYPEIYGTSPGGAQTTYAPNQYASDAFRFQAPQIKFRPPQYPTFPTPQYAAMGGEIRRFAEGGIASLGPDYERKIAQLEAQKAAKMAQFANKGPGPEHFEKIWDRKIAHWQQKQADALAGRGQSAPASAPVSAPMTPDQQYASPAPVAPPPEYFDAPVAPTSPTPEAPTTPFLTQPPVTSVGGTSPLSPYMPQTGTIGGTDPYANMAVDYSQVFYPQQMQSFRNGGPVQGYAEGGFLSAIRNAVSVAPASEPSPEPESSPQTYSGGIGGMIRRLIETGVLKATSPEPEPEAQAAPSGLFGMFFKNFKPSGIGQRSLDESKALAAIREAQKYAFTPGGARTVPIQNTAGLASDMYERYAAPQVQFNAPQQFSAQQRFARGGIAALAPKRYNVGGYAGGGPGKFPRRTGPINGPGTGTSDSIPAMLSDGEFVMTAKAVRGAGNGSRREGAKRMYQMMHGLERKA